jgi:hypothetical protein
MRAQPNRLRAPGRAGAGGPPIAVAGRVPVPKVSIMESIAAAGQREA